MIPAHSPNVFETATATDVAAAGSSRTFKYFEDMDSNVLLATCRTISEIRSRGDQIARHIMRYMHGIHNSAPTREGIAELGEMLLEILKILCVEKKIPIYGTTTTTPRSVRERLLHGEAESNPQSFNESDILKTYYTEVMDTEDHIECQRCSHVAVYGCHQDRRKRFPELSQAGVQQRGQNWVGVTELQGQARIVYLTCLNMITLRVIAQATGDLNLIEDCDTLWEKWRQLFRVK